MTDRPTDPTRLDLPAEDAGAFIGHEPERATETIPGGVGPEDERISAVSTQSTGVGGLVGRDEEPDEPSGHREGPAAGEGQVREAGQDR